MSSSGATALARLAQNPRCELLGAMVMAGGSETRFYKNVTGHDYDREFGERQSSRRRGVQFEQNAYAGDARLLREALSDFIGIAADDIRVRNFLDDFPGTREDARIARLRATRRLLATGPSGEGPHILIQPQLLVPTRPGFRPYFFVAPDLLVFDPDANCYLPGDLKSFIVRENEVSAGDLARVRLQLAAQNLGLQHEYGAVRQDMEVPEHGLLIFSKPNGLYPHAPRIERIGGALEAVRIGIAAYLRHRDRIEALGGGAAPHAVAEDLEPHFEEACLSSCVMAQWCRRGRGNVASDLGDIAKDILGDLPIERMMDLMTGAVEPADDRERSIAKELQRIAAAHETPRVA